MEDWIVPTLVLIGLVEVLEHLLVRSQAVHWAPSMIEPLCILVVGLAGAYLVALGVGALVMPAKVARFLLGFASTPTLHFVELLIRVLVGGSLIVAGPLLSPPQPFVVLGWILLGTSTLLLFVPWQWHRRFASSAVPVANRYIGFVGIASLVGGVLILVAVLRWFGR